MKKLILLLLTLISLTAFGQHQWHKWNDATGTDTYSVTVSTPTWPGSYTKNELDVKFGNTNTGSASLRVNLGSYIDLRMWDGDSWELLTAGQLDVNTVYTVKYQGSYFEVFGASTSGGSSTFQSLTDGPGAYAGKTLNFVRVNTGETALEYQTPSQVKTDIGLSNVDNTSDATKNSASVSLTNKDLTSGTNTFPTFNQNTTGSAAIVTTTINSGVVATTQSAGDNSTKVATTAYVASATYFRGAYDASGNTFPASGGSGASGAILAGDTWYFSVAATSLDGSSWPVKTLVVALVNTPGQTVGNWRLY